MIVCKFGGSSISNVENIVKVSDIISSKFRENNKAICVFSAIGKTTDDLLKCGNIALTNITESITLLTEIENRHNNIAYELLCHDENKNTFEEIDFIFTEIDNVLKGIFYLKDFSLKTRDRLLSYGEILSATIIFSYLYNRFSFLNPMLIDSLNYIKTDTNYGNASPNFNETQRRLDDFFYKYTNSQLFVISGFISSDLENNVTTLGRGGGDYTSAIMGYCLNSEIVEIWTDVNGIMSSDPRKVKTAFNLPKISYKEMLELSHYGANVIYTPTISPLYKKKIPIVIKNTNNPDAQGTVIDYAIEERESIATALSTLENIAVLKIYGEYLIGKIGFTGKLFSYFSNNNINVIMISQSSSEHSIYISIYLSDLDKTLRVLNTEYTQKIEDGILSIEYYSDKSIIAIETDNQNNIINISASIFPLLKRHNINVYTQATSDHNICIVIDRDHVNKTLNMIHNYIFFNKKKNLFIFGCGLVGKELIEQIIKQNKHNIVFIANSRKHLFDINGISDNWDGRMINESKRGIFDKTMEKIIDYQLPNSVVIDCTASDEIYPYYKKFLDNNISVVTPNKKANTTDYSLYEELSGYCNYKFETTVGAGLPIVQTIQNIINSGDTILKVEAILSGTLSYIFNTYMNTNDSFYSVVKNAEKLGYTEPNPKDDLDGMDVVRKILIISRLCGLSIEIDDIENNKFLSRDCLLAKDKNEFYKHLELFSGDMEKTREFAKENKLKPKHIAILENGNARVQLSGVDKNSVFYNLSGSDNVVVITTQYYKQNPIIIRGPGAGAEVTAAGILSDIGSL